MWLIHSDVEWTSRACARVAGKILVFKRKQKGKESIRPCFLSHSLTFLFPSLLRYFFFFLTLHPMVPTTITAPCATTMGSPSRARPRRRATLAAAPPPSSSPWFSGENHLKPPPSLLFSRWTARHFEERTPPMDSSHRPQENPLLGFCFRCGPPRAAAGGVFRRAPFQNTEDMTAKLFISSFHIRDIFWVRSYNFSQFWIAPLRKPNSLSMI